MRNDYPLASEKIEISHNIVSKYCSSIAVSFSTKIGGVNKLIPKLTNKNKYDFYYKNRQLYLSLGMKLSKVYRILKFKSFFLNDE